MPAKKKMGALLAIGLLWPAVLSAQHDRSQYVAHQNREIKALAPDDVAALLSGDGMGLALPAELNGFPGPRHVLELAAQLELSAEQMAATQRIYDSMKIQAVELGTQIVELERRLDRAFADRTIDHEQLQTLTGEIAEAQGRLRAVHLGAHLELASILSVAQRQTYDRLRGYSAQHH